MDRDAMNGIDHGALSEERKATVLAELARIVEHPSFRGSRRCCRFLEYSVHQVLKGSMHDGLKERTIGVEALQRAADYDTSEDAIVRVTANEVRKRLAQYYQDAGSPANLMIGLPLGSYAASLQWLEAPETEPAPPVPGSWRRLWPWIAPATALLVVVAALGLYRLFVGGRTGVPATHANVAVPSAPAKADPFWSRILNSGHKTNIVLSDAVYREIQYFLGRDVSLSEYLAPGYPGSLLSTSKPELKSAVAFLGRQQTTSIGSATLGSRLLAFGTHLGGNPVIRYPRHINVREFKTDNFILLGSRLSVPWVELFEPSLNFPLATDKETNSFYLRNLAPLPGEQAEYRESSNQEETYADIAVLPNLSGTGTVLVLNGIDMVAAESAGEFAVNGSLAATLASMQWSGASAPGSRYAEILLRIRAMAGTAADVRVVATREVTPRVLDAGQHQVPR
jgi:hypothetical protein